MSSLFLSKMFAKLERTQRTILPNIFYSEWNHWTNWTQISYGDSLGWGDKSLFKWSWSHDHDGRHTHIWINPLKNLLRRPWDLVCSIGDETTEDQIFFRVLCNWEFFEKLIFWKLLKPKSLLSLYMFNLMRQWLWISPKAFDLSPVVTHIGSPPIY